MVERDTSRIGVGVVLQQKGHLIAFITHKIAERHIKLLAYDWELIGLEKKMQH